MKNFDEKRKARPPKPADERTFVIGGETFIVRDRVRPNVLAVLDSIVEAKVVDGRVVERGSPIGHDLDVMDDFIAQLVEGDDAAERWKRVRENADDPLELADVQDVLEFVTEVATGRTPTTSGSASTPGPESTGESSTGGSSSPALAAA